MAKMKIKKGDLVQVITGRAQRNGGDRGKQGKVIAVYPETQRVLVEGVNRVKQAHQGRHRPAAAPAPAASSPRRPRSTSATWQLVDPETKTPTRVETRVETVERDGRRRPPASASPSAPVRTSDDHDRQLQPRTAAPRLKPRYREEIAPALLQEFGFANVMQVPGLVKIVVNMGVGEAARDSKLIEGAVRDLTAITGQKPVGHQGPQVDRAVQAARGHADRRARHAARRPHVGVPRPAAVASALPAHP